MGTSSGAIMAQALLGLYPDVFKAGASFSGVADGCWADSYSSSSQWSGTCAGGNVTKTAQQWGDLVRAQDPTYTGARPRVQLWHGTADVTINYTNLGESIKQWTNVLGLGSSPTSTDTPKAGFTRQSWQNTCGLNVLEAYIQANGPHGTAIDADALVRFFALDKAGADAGAAACP